MNRRSKTTEKAKATSPALAASPAPRKSRTPAARTPPRSPKEAASCCGVIDDLLKPELFKALCDPTRARLVGCLIKCGRPCTVSEVAECCSVDFSVVSRHLQQLARAEILDAVRSGRTVSYAVRFTDLCATLRALADAIEEHSPTNACCCTGGCCGPR
jgi:ArsR family transcriptional regulator